MGLFKSDPPPPPPPPNPYSVAAAQTQGDVQSAIANAALGNPNVVTPLGTSSWAQTGTQTITDAQGNPITVPTYTNTQTLSPEQQALYNQQTQIGGKLNNIALSQADKIGSLLNTNIDASKLPQVQSSYGAAPTFQGPVTPNTMQGSFNTGAPIQTSFNGGQPLRTDAGQANQFADAGTIQQSVGPQDFSTDRQAVTDALLSRINPQIELDRQRLEQRLANQGISMGTDAWNKGTDALNRQVNDQRMQAILAGGQEQSRLANLQLQQAQYGLGAQNQAYNQAQGRGSFANDANMNNAAFYNQAQAQQYGQNQGQAAFNNAAAGQQFGQNQSAVNFANNAAAANTAAQQNARDIQNSLAQQGYVNQQNAATFNNQAAQQALQTQIALRNQPINEIGALQSQGQVTMPQFQGYNAPTIAGSTVGQNTYNSAALANQNYAQQVAAQSAANAGLYGLGAAGIMGALSPAPTKGLGGTVIGSMLSDRRLKRDVIDIGIRLPNGLKIYSYRYLGPDEQSHVGVMADEARLVMPDAVERGADGYDRVDYSIILAP